jgi:hypothetical protein
MVTRLTMIIGYFERGETVIAHVIIAVEKSSYRIGW